MKERRAALGGYLPHAGRPRQAARAARRRGLRGAARRARASSQVATTMAFVRLLKDLMKDKEIGKRFVPIIPDEARTFGMDSMFPTAKIYSPHGQSYEAGRPRPAAVLQGVDAAARSCTRASARPARWRSLTAAGTAYATHGEPMIPVYIFYSMFGFQRTGDQMWALGRPARPRLPARRDRRPHHAERRGSPARRTATRCCSPRPTRPCVAYDPAFAFEIAHIIQDGLRRMYGRPPSTAGENVFYYLTRLQRADQPQPAEPPERSTSDGLLRGLYRYAARTASGAVRTATPPAGRSSLASGVGHAAGRSRRSSCSPRTGASPPTSGRRPPGTSCAATRVAATSTTCCIPRRAAGCRT